MLEGLATLQVLDLIRTNPCIMRQLFVYVAPKRITADYILSLFSEAYSPQGSNVRVEEEAAAMKWVHFIQHIEGKEQVEAISALFIALGVYIIICMYIHALLLPSMGTLYIHIILYLQFCFLTDH